MQENIKFWLLLLILSLTGTNLFAQISKEQQQLENFLSEQKDIVYSKLNTDSEALKYELRIRQPLDWKDLEKGYFLQKVILTHTGFDKPVLMETQGYQMYDTSNELQKILNSNDINVEHRYFGVSLPDSSDFDWKYLNLYNATHDLHHINQIFKKIYGGKWISTGISKGGQTTIYYRYFFPDDIDVSIPYVAPVNYTLEDKRIFSFLENVGSQECRKKIFDFQEFLLKNEEKAIPYIKDYSLKKGITYKYVGSVEKAYELNVLEYAFSFWQWGYSCNEIPKNPTVQEAVEYMLKICDISFFGDESIKEIAPHYYQAGTEMGYYGYDIAPFKKYIKHFDENPSAVFAPKDAGNIIYSGELNENLKSWLENKADNIIYIYGGLDTWSATKVVPSVKTNSVIFELPDASHRTARIKNMNAEMKEKLGKLIYKWIGIKPDFNKID